MIIRTFGIEALFAWTAVVHVLTAAFALFRMTQRAAAPLEDHIAFSEALVVAQTVSTVDPLSSDGADSGQANDSVAVDGGAAAEGTDANTQAQPRAGAESSESKPT